MTMSLDEPPPWVTKHTLWRLAMCVMRDHTISDTGTMEVCVRCGDDWPCTCRTLAERAVAEALRRSTPRPPRNQAYLDLLRERRAERPTDDP
jgi:tartrate dehydratase alpha subunit/fumarate hydratase class I-like protein